MSVHEKINLRSHLSSGLNPLFKDYRNNGYKRLSPFLNTITHPYFAELSTHGKFTSKSMNFRLKF